MEHRASTRPTFDQNQDTSIRTRTVTSWIRAARLSDQFRPCYTAVAAAAKKTDRLAARRVTEAVRPLVADAERLTRALDDTPTRRYGPHVQGAGIHHNPTPGPAGAPYVHGHVFVVLGPLACHRAWGVIALPLLSRMYVREADLAGIDPKHRPEFRTKLQLAVEPLRWAVTYLGALGKPLWLVADGAYAKREVLKAAKSLGVTVVSRLRRDAAPGSLTPAIPADRRGPGRPRVEEGGQERHPRAVRVRRQGPARGAGVDAGGVRGEGRDPPHLPQ